MRKVLGRRGLESGGYVLFLSRLSAEKGADDLIDGFARTASSAFLRLVVAGNGPAEADLRARAERSSVADRILFLDDVDDAEKWSLMAGSAAFVLPSKPKPHFVETFGIALAEKMLAGGGPVITTSTGGIPEAVGDTATIVPIDSPTAIAAAIDEAVFELTYAERRARAEQARAHAMQFDRLNVFDRLVSPVGTVYADA
jgi:glycosyltransferase involved in cell wall biosynthesis